MNLRLFFQRIRILMFSRETGCWYSDDVHKTIIGNFLRNLVPTLSSPAAVSPYETGSVPEWSF